MLPGEKEKHGQETLGSVAGSPDSKHQRCLYTAETAVLGSNAKGFVDFTDKDFPSPIFRSAA